MTYDRTAALTALREHVHNEHLIAHMVATEAVMKAIARDKGEDEEAMRAVREEFGL